MKYQSKFVLCFFFTAFLSQATLALSAKSETGKKSPSRRTCLSYSLSSLSAMDWFQLNNAFLECEVEITGDAPYETRRQLEVQQRRIFTLMDALTNSSSSESSSPEPATQIACIPAEGTCYPDNPNLGSCCPGLSCQRSNPLMAYWYCM
jgi:hypothetical protein